MFELLFFIGIPFITFIIYCLIQRETKKTLLRDLKTYHEDILTAEKEFQVEYNKDRYFSKRNLNSWQNKWKHLEPIVTRFQKMQLKDVNIHNSITNVYNIFKNGCEVVQERNNAYIQREGQAFKPLFDTLEAYPLTESQRRSIIVDEWNNLVVAGAGTGKTSAIVGKVGYITRKGLAKTDEILLLAFARDARNEMEDRIKSRLGIHLNVQTFHALGLNIIAESEGIKPSVSKLAGDPQRLHQKIQQFIQHKIGADEQSTLDNVVERNPSDKNEFLQKLNNYFLYHLRPYKSHFEFSSLNEYFDYLKENQIRSLKGDLVKSYEECEIANFLYVNGIQYEYEKDYEVSTVSREHRQYKPDFYLPDYGVYIEHIGINKDGLTAPYVNKDEYLKEMRWKRSIHQQHNTKLIETYSHEKADGTLLTHLEQALKRHNVQFNKIPDEEIFAKINELGVVDPFVSLLVTFLNLFKSCNLTLDELREKAKRLQGCQRYLAFLDVFESVYNDYASHLQEIGEIDFNDMINQATTIVNQQKHRSKYSYILVDEFQDISQSRYRLLKSLLDQNPNCKLFCVGDDWQSIYRFTGSDITVMTEFPDYFGVTEQMYLDQTFRFNNKICDFSSKFIMKNRSQIPKQLTTNQLVDPPAISLQWSITETRDVIRCLTDINRREAGKASVFILGRYNRQRPEHLWKIKRQFPKLSIAFHTIHKSKGQEADYVIVAGLNSGLYGFPCQIEDDPVLNFVLAKEDKHPNAEERRLFYVAVTRARKHVYLVADPTYPSSFINEILRGGYEVNVLNDHQARACPRCGYGRLVRRNGRHGDFLGCSNYPRCYYTEDFKQSSR